MEIVNSKVVTGKTMFECLYEPFTKRHKKAGGKDDRMLFSAVELTPHIFVTMGPVNKDLDKYIAICIQNDYADDPYILKSTRVDEFDRDNAETGFHLLMLDLFEDIMAEAGDLRESFQCELEEALDFVIPFEPDDNPEE